MAERTVRVLGDPILKRVAERVGEVDDALATDLLDTMAVSPGCVGLAAPQIGVSRRAFVLDVSGHKKGIGVGDDGRLPALQDGDDGVRGPEVDANSSCHVAAHLRARGRSCVDALIDTIAIAQERRNVCEPIGLRFGSGAVRCASGG